MIIVITGTPGTGKSSIAKIMAKKTKWNLIDVRELVNRKKIFRIKNKEKEVDIKKLEKTLLKEINAASSKLRAAGIIVEGHLACELKLKADYVFVLRCRPEVLKKRLSSRKYRKEKLEENIIAELLDYCTVNAENNIKYPKERLFEIRSEGENAEKVANRILKIIRGERKKSDYVPYKLQKYLRYLK